MPGWFAHRGWTANAALFFSWSDRGFWSEQAWWASCPLEAFLGSCHILTEPIGQRAGGMSFRD
ncbi:hypothetical protein AA0473_1205 [Acetobacter orleanensis NRIC 0473]|uniref:Uncharacterized protein n=1 Tax=Acetobacter orleanensis TaxID=104099 RepID=A0A4Y3THU6_9PROT|nr:hypothetical protein Abol_003_057 [Acetobacter orleanensis JCM 7639]GBR26687.1 hypothetical protein AA0473_1205 [Acetobacter orleanensis NRIC 0473]GEB81856.1 hypothetical protein AOR01nite_03330 [Acetobacter orleanensis]